MRCKKTAMRLVLYVLFVLLLGGIIILEYGDSQWHRYIYIYQAYIHPKGEYTRGFICPPRGYTGIWRTYYPNGQIESESMFDNGEPTVPYYLWSEEGNLIECQEPDGMLNSRRKPYIPPMKRIGEEKYKEEPLQNESSILNSDSATEGNTVIPSLLR